MVSQFVEALDEVNGFQVFVAAILVGNPLAGLAGVVQIDHGCNGINAQAVDVIAVEPEQRVRQKEVPHLVATVVEDQGSPISMFAEPGVRMLIEIGAIKISQPMPVLRKVGWHPIEQHTHARLMAAIHKGTELFRGPEAARRREVADHLIAPRSVKGMLRQRHQLNVRVSHLLNIGNEPVGQLAVSQVAIVLLRHAHPRAQVDFIDGNR